VHVRVRAAAHHGNDVIVRANSVGRVWLRIVARGAGGGYTLSRAPEEITAGDVVRALEGPIEPQVCTAEGDPVLNCVREQDCGTRAVWHKLQATIARALDAMTLDQVARQTEPQQ